MKNTTTGLLVTPTINADKKSITLNIKHIDMSQLKDAQTQLERIYALLECRTIDIVCTPKGDIYIDDEGLLVEYNPVISFSLDENSQNFNLAGILLFSNGTDAEGNTIWFDKNKIIDLATIKDIEESLKKYTFLGFSEY